MSIKEALAEANEARPVQQETLSCFSATREELKDLKVNFVPPIPKCMPPIAWVLGSQDKKGWVDMQRSTCHNVVSAALTELATPMQGGVQTQVHFYKSKLQGCCSYNPR